MHAAIIGFRTFLTLSDKLYDGKKRPVHRYDKEELDDRSVPKVHQLLSQC